MLVLSRKKSESIVINDNITIVVVEIRGDKVRLGVEAPKEVSVHRQEVYDAMNRAGFADPAIPLVTRIYDYLKTKKFGVTNKTIAKIVAAPIGEVDETLQANKNTLFSITALTAESTSWKVIAS